MSGEKITDSARAAARAAAAAAAVARAAMGSPETAGKFAAHLDQPKKGPEPTEEVLRDSIFKGIQEQLAKQEVGATITFQHNYDTAFEESIEVQGGDGEEAELGRAILKAIDTNRGPLRRNSEAVYAALRKVREWITGYGWENEHPTPPTRPGAQYTETWVKKGNVLSP